MRGAHPLDVFIDKLAKIPLGYSRGIFNGHPYKVLHSLEFDGKREKLYAEDLLGSDHISFNLYRLTDGRTLLRPCEMPEDKVRAFVLGVEIVPE